MLEAAQPTTPIWIWFPYLLTCYTGVGFVVAMDLWIDTRKDTWKKMKDLNLVDTYLSSVCLLFC